MVWGWCGQLCYGQSEPASPYLPALCLPHFASRSCPPFLLSPCPPSPPQPPSNHPFFKNGFLDDYSSWFLNPLASSPSYLFLIPWLSLFQIWYALFSYLGCDVEVLPPYHHSSFLISQFEILPYQPLVWRGMQVSPMATLIRPSSLSRFLAPSLEFLSLPPLLQGMSIYFT